MCMYFYYIKIYFYFLQYNGAKIQLLDLPGIIEGAAQGKNELSIHLLLIPFHLSINLGDIIWWLNKEGFSIITVEYNIYIK